jgi:tRNA U34 5-carboxymethylaminomethyl modifying enzyme MnmG/GidA
MPADLINTLETPGEFDALLSLRKEEPYFLLVGRDRFAPPLILRWASYNRRRALKEFDAGLIDTEERERELRKSTQAEEIAWSMREFKLGGAGKAETKQDRYSGYVDTEEQKRADTIHRQRLEAKSALHNAISETNDLYCLIASEDERQARAIEETIRAMRALAELVTPKRPGVDK